MKKDVICMKRKTVGAVKSMPLFKIMHIRNETARNVSPALAVVAKSGQLRDLVDSVSKHGMPMTISNSHGKRAVLIPAESWRAINETIYLNSIPGLVESIKASSNEPLDDCEVYDPDEEW